MGVKSFKFEVLSLKLGRGRSKNIVVSFDFQILNFRNLIRTQNSELKTRNSLAGEQLVVDNKI